MMKSTLFLAILCLILLSSCKNTPTTPQTTAPNFSDSTSKSSVPDPNDLLKTLQGRWQSELDTTDILEIDDTQMRHIHGGQQISQSMIDVDGACKSPVCKPEGVDTSDGWCFTEMTVVDGKYNAQCNFVTLCNLTQLHYQLLDGNGSGLSFKKIP